MAPQSLFSEELGEKRGGRSVRQIAFSLCINIVPIIYQAYIEVH
jgi:hypothetical protein